MPKMIRMNPDLLAEAVHIGQERVRLNDAEKMGHKQYYHQRGAREGNHDMFWYPRGTIGEAAVVQYLTDVSNQHNLPAPEWTGGFAWTRAEREANAYVPDVTWLGLEIEVKTMEDGWGFAGIKRYDVQKNRIQIVCIPEILTWQEFEQRGSVFTDKVLLKCAIILSQFKNIVPATGEALWYKLPIPKYDNTHGYECRTVPQSYTTHIIDWTNTTVAEHKQYVAA